MSKCDPTVTPYRGCIYSRSMNQAYPRKCIVCGETEKSEDVPMVIRDKQSFILGMELAMRIARNRTTGKDLSDPAEQMLQTTIGVIRLVQVEIGSGRMTLPEPHEWTEEEIDEVERIS